jgi:uncharacterized protein with beta-barrel porin domain
MAKIHRVKKWLCTASALTLGFGPLVTVNGSSGIFTGTITSFIPATFKQAEFDPGTPAMFTQANFTPETFNGGIFPGTVIVRSFPTTGDVDFPEQIFSHDNFLEADNAGNFNNVINDTFTFTPAQSTPATFTPATFEPGTPAAFTPAEFTPNTPDTPATFTPATIEPGTPATFIPATFTPATFTPGPEGNTQVSSEVPQNVATFTQATFTPATFTSGTPATFNQAIFDPGNQGTPSGLVSDGQRFAVGNIGQLCAQDNSIACTLSAGVDGITAQNLSPQAAIQAETIAITSPYQFIRSINDGMQLIMAGRTSAGVGNFSGQTRPSLFLMRTFATVGSTPSASAYGFIGPFGVLFSGGGNFGNQNNAEGQTGFKVDTHQANLMIDYSFNQKLIGGFSFGYLGADRNLNLASGSLSSDSYRFAPFLLFRPTTNSYLNVMGGYVLVNYDSTRSVLSSSGITFNNATAKYDADQFFASVGGGYTLAKGGWSLRGYARGDYSHIDIKSFQEKGGLATDQNGNSLSLAMQVNKQNIQSVTSTLGAELSHAISTRTFIPVIIPRLRAEWVHEFENDSRIVRAGFIDQNGANLTFGSMAVAGPVRNWANLGLGVQMLFARSIVGYVNYDRLIMSHANNNTISGGIRMNF